MKILANFDRKRLLPSAAALLLGLTLSACGPAPDGPPQRIVKGLPWQINSFEDGSSEVFGLRLGHTTLAEALEIIAKDSESAIVIDQQNHASLESYISHYKAGPLQGRLILVADIPASQLQQMIQNLEHGDYMASGARKLLPTDADWEIALQAPIASISFIPAINLDEDIIVNRFGQAATQLQSEEVDHFLYPDKGLDIALSEDGKEVLQYIAPRQFHKLSQPLLNNPRYQLADNK
ncbi:hypothetical protein G8768_16765 [Pseudoteredinibacter isoporae]|uniref:Uncharacterized protein n=1 Tax=Pseudoteredinibacter isoporae TaxID=570281 RepID=A0A7X0JVM8_9GAMM|nr:hypothetical protein [Pseudoteredinibacter isoporae]MBB6523100.1 hypothetical protein [Pseudoteredinibacter isoporae]NHO88620.1 hypothetical protein [Pseudoteredinibacter isoporae]NIB22689.1 hypothetical protein [Pseudoteredinibacter isoporae]